MSVLITNYNYARYVGEAIESVLRQEYPAIEVVVCDDGSSDGSCEVIRQHAARDPRVQFIAKENGGHASALNDAFAVASGEVLCLLDADDTFKRHKLERVVQAFRESPAAGMVVHDTVLSDLRGHQIYAMHLTHEGYIGPQVATLSLAGLFPPCSALAFRRQVLEHILPLPAPQFRTYADMAIAHAAACITETSVVPEVLADYRYHGSNITAGDNRGGLSVPALEKRLSDNERLYAYLDDFVRAHCTWRMNPNLARPLVEHRLALAILRGDSARARDAARDLARAYRTVRQDYPWTRYVAWQVLAILSNGPARRILLEALRRWPYVRHITRGGGVGAAWVRRLLAAAREGQLRSV